MLLHLILILLSLLFIFNYIILYYHYHYYYHYYLFSILYYYYNKLGLVDGIITEDSDAFLFGGNFVYRFIFEDKKYAELYSSSDIQNELGLNRYDLISLAFFLGSDYTEGIKGIGIVNAMEIISTFINYQNSELVNSYDKILHGLKMFKYWFDYFTIHLKNAQSKKDNQEYKQSFIEHFLLFDANLTFQHLEKLVI